jgi:branched-chain amino acid transport system permease protein
MILMQSKHIAPWWGIWAGTLMALITALIIGSICFRLRGPYFVLASIAVAEIIRLLALNWKDLTNGAEGILAGDLPPLKLGSSVITDWNSKTPYYYMGLAMAVFCILVNDAVKRSKVGYYLQAIREDQDAAHSLGIPLTLYKNIGLLISAACTALAGSFAAFYIGFIEPQAVFGLDVSVQVVLICIIGGIGTVTGPMIGAVILVLLSEALRANLLGQVLPVPPWLKDNLAHAHVLIYGVLVIIVILFMPDGFVGFFGARLRRRASR